VLATASIRVEELIGAQKQVAQLEEAAAGGRAQRARRTLLQFGQGDVTGEGEGSKDTDKGKKRKRARLQMARAGEGGGSGGREGEWFAVGSPHDASGRVRLQRSPQQQQQSALLSVAAAVATSSSGTSQQPPTVKPLGFAQVRVTVSQSVCLSVCVLCLFCLSVCLSVCVSVSWWKDPDLRRFVSPLTHRTTTPQRPNTTNTTQHDTTQQVPLQLPTPPRSGPARGDQRPLPAFQAAPGTAARGGAGRSMRCFVCVIGDGGCFFLFVLGGVV
jgi:hypothetical protein